MTKSSRLGNVAALRCVAIVIFALHAKANGAPGDFAWARLAGAGASEESRGLGVAADLLGQTYVCGYFTGSASFGMTNLASAGLEDIFVAKYDVKGNLLWARRAGGTAYDEAHAIAVDGAGNAFVTGFFQGVASFGSTNLTSSGASDVFLAKYSPSGGLVWVRRAGGSDYDEANGMAVDLGGEVWLTGYFNGTATFGGLSVSSLSASNQLFVAKCDANGSFQWVRRAGGSDDVEGMALAVGTNRSAAVTGRFAGSANFGSTNLTATPGNSGDIFVACYAPSGDLLWARQGGGNGKDEGAGIAISPGGEIAVTGYFSGSALFGATNVTGSGQDIFVAKYSQSGDLRWVRKAGGNNAIYGDAGAGVVVDELGRVWATGSFSGTASFSGTNLVTTAFLDIFVGCYTPEGELLWVIKAGGGNVDAAKGLVLDNGGNLLLTGFFSGTATFGSTNLLSTAGGAARDIFVARMTDAEAPRLSVTKTLAGVRLIWPSADSDFRLETREFLEGASWVLWSGATNIEGAWRVVEWPMSGQGRMFRLVR